MIANQPITPIYGMIGYHVTLWGRMHQPEVWTNPRGIARVNLENDIPRMHHAGVNVARG